ncbi:MAG TPA: GNAT family N-acetyltransferase [Syntrophobacter fumaroxidans]|nr:GNAT family N-acetyltransferase [Syntrophobacter fumaroxidans]
MRNSDTEAGNESRGAFEFSSPLSWRSLYKERLTTAERAIEAIKRGHRVFIGSGCSEPQHLAQALEEAIPSLADLEILHILSVGKTRYTEAGFDKCRLKSFFVASASREAVAQGRADYTPINLGDVPALFRSGAMPIDVALIQVSPPDEHGFCSYGIAVDIVKAAAESARLVIAQVNPRMPMTLGDSFIHIRDIHVLVEHEAPLLEVGLPLMNPIAQDIGRHVATLIEDGSTIRVGVGSISTAVLYALENKKDLGVHADMITDAYMHLVKKGVITNARKTLHPGKIVTSFCLGSRELYDFVDNNPMVAFHPIEYTNNYLVISENDQMVSINPGLEVDLTGQVCSDSMGYEIYSGVGGAIDFLRGARGSRGGKAIMVLPSTTLDGSKSRIVPVLTEGSGVVMTRGGVQYVVTEYGSAYLLGRSTRERALALIGIAHPDFREELMEAAETLNYLQADVSRGPSTRAVYPLDWEVSHSFDIQSKVFIRPVKPTDERAIKEFFYSLPKSESYIRFLSVMKVFPHYDVRSMVNIDYRREMSVIALVGEMSSQRVVAIARYVLDEATMTAEVDFAVHPEHSRQGLATVLVHHMAEGARNNGVKRLVAYISAGNERVFGVFQKTGFLVQSSFREGVYEIRVDLQERAQVCLLL